ncbi:hypothetical protein EDB83DRAFT_2674814 [Lactarius deliciosus]|nr:hypothetical protein EDB83DRAFT_2674814 [Lactarius deliciosus]
MSNPLIPPNVAEIAAPILLGTLWNWTLYGVLVVQTYVYSYNFPEDRTLIKLLVYSVFLVETVQTALSGTDLYYWFVSGFGKMDHLTAPYNSAFDVPIMGSMVALIVQFYFVYRIWVLSKRSSCLVICLFSIVAAVGGIYGGVYTHVYKQFASGRMLKILALTWVSGNALADVLIAGSLLFYLVRRHREGGHFSDHALSRVVRLTIETNVLTSFVGIVALLTIAIFPDKPWFTCPYVSACPTMPIQFHVSKTPSPPHRTAIFGKLYSNTLLVSLNNRISIREGRGAVVRSPPFTANSQPESASEIVHVEFEKPSAALVVGSLEDGAGRDTSGVIDICVTRDQVVV